MRPLWVNNITKKIQKVGWLYLTENFVISCMNDFKMVDANCECALLPIGVENSHRVAEFRERERVAEYEGKVAKGEIGFFAECNGRVTGSIWATKNYWQNPIVVRTYMRLMPNEALIHDIVTGDEYRGRCIGPFMLSSMAATLLNDYRVSRIVVDVNVRNKSSLRMMHKAGLRERERALYLSVGGTLVFQKTLKQNTRRATEEQERSEAKKAYPHDDY